MKKLIRGERGFSLLEVLVAGALLSVVAVSLLAAMGTGSKGLSLTDRRATAESLARSQMEYVRNQDYNTDPSSYAIMPDIPAEFDVAVTGVNLDPNWNSLQKITVTVSPNGGGLPIVELEGYRSWRG